MNVAFPDARLASRVWAPLVPVMTNHHKDRHVLAAAVGFQASHVATSNLRDFPVASRPAGLLVQRPDAFLLLCLATEPERMLSAVRAMAARHQRPPHSPHDLAVLMSQGELVPRFGATLIALLGSPT